ncbi:MAG TPA: methyl-accepting chemotaxis protein [Dissulfurispiraceae bacterium]
MTIRQKLTINVVLIGAVILLMAAISVSGLVFIRSKLSYLLSNSTPFQVRTTDLQRTLQSSVSDLFKASLSAGNDEFTRQKANFGKSAAEVKEAEDALERLDGQHRGLYGEIEKLSAEIFETTEKRLQSESETGKAGAVISEKMKDLTAKLQNLDKRVSAMQAGYSKGLRDDFEASKTSSAKLQDMEALRTSLGQLNNMVLTLPYSKDRTHIPVMKSKVNGILDTLLQSPLVKSSRETSALASSLKQKVPGLFELYSAYVKNPDEGTLQKMEAVSAEMRDKLIQPVILTINQNVDFLSSEAASRNKHQDLSLAQSGIATGILSDNAAFTAAGLSIEGNVTKLLNASTPKEIDSLGEEIRKGLDKAEHYEKSLDRDLLKLGARDELALVRGTVSALNSVRGLVFSRDGLITKLRLQVEMKGRAADAGNRLRQTVNKFTESGRQDILTAHKAQEDSAAAVNRVVGLSIFSGSIISAAAILVSILISVILFRTVVVPIRQTKEVFESAERDNDLTKRPDGRKKDEIGELCGSYNRFMDRLHDAVSRISGFTGQVASAADQLAATSKQMTGKARDQAEQATGIATASEEMSATVLDVAKNAQSASEYANDLKSTAMSGGEIVHQSIAGIKAAAASIEEISRMIGKLAGSSEKIGEIVAVIKGIADQTNLLALNAAIEAARAGEQGRGFAVVADEVRKLAESTTGATAEIAEMIRNIQMETENAAASMSKGLEDVNKGVEFSNKAGDVLNEMLQGIGKITDMMGNIAAASNEQTTTVDVIASNINQISGVANEFAAAMEQSERASGELNRLSSELRVLASRFRV